MKCDRKNMILYAVTDRSWVGKQSLIEQVESALKGGVSCVQLREKQLDKEAFLKEAVEMAALCRQYKVPFIINDDVDIALRCGADGVHVGQDDMSVDKVRSIAGDDLIIGVSAHSVEEALTAVRGGADYLGVGAVFQTSTKTNVTAMSYEVLKSICTAVDIPVVAIGGINKDNMTKLAGTGISGVALVSAVFAADDIERECRILRSMSEEITA
ncbi:MAG: thiamine phosphate synthase [Lachnospiraceae bacterium]|nr:thiamine phosphate synthase [Lachnospiraceae bacterium]